MELRFARVLKRLRSACGRFRRIDPPDIWNLQIWLFICGIWWRNSSGAIMPIAHLSGAKGSGLCSFTVSVLTESVSVATNRPDLRAGCYAMSASPFAPMKSYFRFGHLSRTSITCPQMVLASPPC